MARSFIPERQALLRSHLSTPAIDQRREERGAGARQASPNGRAATAGRLGDHSERPAVGGKFLTAGGRKLLVRGVTYGTFRPRADGSGYPDPATVSRDFAAMAASGVNSVRTYTPPPRWLLDLAAAHGLYVMVGLAWEDHVAFLDDRGRADDIERRVRAGVRACSGHPAVLCYAVGNEIAPSIVRWHGRRRIERHLRRLHEAAKDEDADAPVTYVNFPSTEYLELDFADFLCFNVYLEEEDRLRAYLARLHNIAGDRPLVLAEIGLDSRRNGDGMQARAVDWQIQAAFEEGCAGAFVFAWTDEWHVGGNDIEDWDFGLTTRDRRPKPALGAVRRAFRAAPHGRDVRWPRVSVIVCSCNGAKTLRECCAGLAALDYPDYEVIFVDDGSTDATASIAAEHGFRVISTENRGLSSARNTGWQAASGEIVAYLDDDASPDPDWLRYLATAFREGGYAGVGGPNIAPLDSIPTAACVAHAPGNPNHVLLSDREAEHIPGCNCAFRREALEAVSGFDPQFRVAGDDVDICWRIRERGWQLGFIPAAMVWHRRRDSIGAYWRQQRGYGRAEAQLERKWPERYNSAGYLSWGGRIYGTGAAPLRRRRARVYHGRWGGAPFQSLYERPSGLGFVPLLPEWYAVTALLLVAGALGALRAPLLWLLPLAGAAAAASVLRATLAARAALVGPARVTASRGPLVVLLCLLQPAARLYGRIEEGLTPWRRHGRARPAPPWPRSTSIWSQRWRSAEERLLEVESALCAGGAVTTSGGSTDRWEHRVRGGSLASAQLRMCVEEHGGGNQLARFRLYPRVSRLAAGAAAALALLATVAVMTGSAGLLAAVAGTALVLAGRGAVEASWAMGELAAALAAVADEEARAIAAAAADEQARATAADVREVATI
jgi:O-antigen biosynthesis protein